MALSLPTLDYNGPSESSYCGQINNKIYPLFYQIMIISEMKFIKYENLIR
jgi:hypothetical protein